MFDPYYKWLGIPQKDQPPNYYRLLSLELFESDLDVIEGAADRVMGFIRQYQSGEHAAATALLLNEVATVRICLLKPATKSEYDAKLRKSLAATPVRSESEPRRAVRNQVQPKDEPFLSVNLRQATAELPVIANRSNSPKRKKAKKRNTGQQPWIALAIMLFAAVFVFALYTNLREKTIEALPPISQTNAATKAAPVIPQSVVATPIPRPVLPKPETAALSPPVDVEPKIATAEPMTPTTSPEPETRPAAEPNITPSSTTSNSAQTQTPPSESTTPEDSDEIGLDTDNLLRNGSFEKSIRMTWKPQSYLSKLECFSVVKDQAKIGTHSLVINVVTADNARCLQKVIVKPMTKYRLSGWVKTKDVKVIQSGGQNGANLCVADIGLTRSLFGDHNWTRLTYDFESRNRREIEVGPRVGYFGSTCVGTAWFDDIRLTEITPGKPRKQK